MAERWATWDCYGTLIDWNEGIGTVLGALFGDVRAGDACSTATTRSSRRCRPSATAPTARCSTW